MLYLYGSGGHAKVIIDILEECKIPIAGIFDQDLSRSVFNYQVIAFPSNFNVQEDFLIVAIGNNIIRKSIVEATKVRYASAIHPKSIISKYATVREGTVVMGGALINADTSIGSHCIINSAASVDHDCTIHNFVHISPKATLCGGVTVEESAHIGTGAIVIPNKKIGVNSIVGAGSVVINDVPDNVTVVGNPAKIIKYNKASK